MAILNNKFQKSRDYTREQLIRDLVDLVKELETALSDITDRLDEAETRLTDGGL